MGSLKARGHPVGATGVYQLVETYLQLTGTAGANQIKAPRIALIQNIGGTGTEVTDGAVPNLHLKFLSFPHIIWLTERCCVSNAISTTEMMFAVWTKGNNVSVKLSILDQSPVNDAETATEAFQHTIELATRAEEWGYHRFWVSEHHGSNRVMGSSPEVLIAHLLAKTTRIRVGSGGVMLQHYSPYKVAENFNVLASLAPGRVDLGIGRGPGGLPQSTRALQQEVGDRTKPLAEKLVELEQFLHNRLEENHPLYGLQVSPMPPQPAEVFLLGTSTSSAALAASLGMPYVFAQFLNSDATTMDEAMETYHTRYDATKRQPLQAMLALSVIAADTDEEARHYASDIKVVRIRLASGRTFTVGTVAAAEEFGRQSQENYTIAIHEANVVHGSRDTVLQQLDAMQRRYQVDELIVVTAIKDFHKRLHSYELLSPAYHL